MGQAAARTGGPSTGRGRPHVATGPGTVARIAAERVGAQGRVVGADFSEAMIAIARAKPRTTGAAPIEYLVSPAAPLDVDDEAFDAVTCQKGLARDRVPAELRGAGCRAA